MSKLKVIKYYQKLRKESTDEQTLSTFANNTDKKFKHLYDSVRIRDVNATKKTILVCTLYSNLQNLMKKCYICPMALQGSEGNSTDEQTVLNKEKM